jgi:hypothetical protein
LLLFLFPGALDRVRFLFAFVARLPVLTKTREFIGAAFWVVIFAYLAFFDGFSVHFSGFE